MVRALAAGPAEGRLTVRILVADHEPGMRKSLAIVLRREGYEVTETASAFGAPETRQEALRRGAADFMETPLQTPELLQPVRKLVEAR